MSHGGHTAASGPSARSDMDATKTGLSEDTASFIAAHCSPFTNPDDLVRDGARVPDPQTTQRTCSTTIYTNLQIPVIPDVWNEGYTGPAATATSGKQFIIVNANPLGNFIPIQWAMRSSHNVVTPTTDANNDYFGIGPSATTQSKTVTRTDPVSWAQIYESANQGDLVSKLYTLGQQSLRHRVVGCAIKVNTGTDATLNRGNIEGGQFEIDMTKAGTVSPLGDTTPTKNGYWYGWDVGSSMTFGYGMYQSRMYDCSYDITKQAIWTARNQNRGILKSEDGISVRWTDSNNFTFVKTKNKCCLVPEKDYYANGVDGELTTAEVTATVSANDIMYRNAYLSREDATLLAPSKASINVISAAYYVTEEPNGTEIFGNAYFEADTTKRTQLSDTPFNSSTGEPGEWSKDHYFSEDLNAHDDFDRGIYIDVTGVSPNQLLNVEVQWIVEYIPRVYSLEQGRFPPIDMNFPAVQATVANPKAYPIVVKGNSFFSSLWHGVKSAAEGVGKLLKGTSNIAAMIPTPQAQAFSKFGGATGELLTGGGIGGAMGRIM